MKIMLKAIFLPLLFIFSSSAFSDSWYKIEVIIFANNDPMAIHEEFWPEINEIPVNDRAVELKGQSNDGDDLTAYQSLPNSRHELNSAKNSLNNSGDYRVLFHKAWVQPVSRTQNPRPIKISAGRVLDNGMQELEGHIAVGRGRYLHFRPDLYISQPGAANNKATPLTKEKPQAQAMLTMQGESDTATETEVQAIQSLAETTSAFPVIPEILTAHQNQARRMKSEELHYIDHPLMGILVEIIPLETE
ncbi:CsiV family protein [Neptuniibacter sp. QD37_6]|uniref:CsiV family protein n=1 Tax=Neptuniibacter sp. QD37_6 TaxID=3398210 RepID=UPI0039F4FBFC